MEAFANTFVHLDSQSQSAVDPVMLLLDAGQPEVETESEAVSWRGNLHYGWKLQLSYNLHVYS